MLRRIQNADDLLINQIVPLLIHRFNTLHPTHELIVISLPKDSPREREEIPKAASHTQS